MNRDELLEELEFYGDIEIPIKCPYTLDNCYNISKSGLCRCSKCEIEISYFNCLKIEKENNFYA